MLCLENDDRINLVISAIIPRSIMLVSLRCYGGLISVNFILKEVGGLIFREHKVLSGSLPYIL